VTVATFCRWVSGRDLDPAEVAFSYPAPADARPYRDALRCPVTFDAPVTSLFYPLEELSKPLSTYNPVLAELHERYAGEYLERFDHGQISYRVREAIIRRLPDGEPRRDQIARELCMSERTLQRRLEEETSSYLQLLNDTRRELAEQYLNRLHLSLQALVRAAARRIPASAAPRGAGATLRRLHCYPRLSWPHRQPRLRATTRHPRLRS